MRYTGLVAFLLGCSSTAPSSLSEPDASDVFGGGSDAGVGGECASETKAVYLITNEADLIRFTPETEDFTIVARLKCGNVDTFPTSMAIDRQGHAFIRYDDEALVTASIKDGKCSTTPYVSQLNIRKFGMGFSTDGKGGETLFLADSGGKGLAKLDTKTFATALVGPFDGEFFGKKAELTGTGDGKLYGFFPDFLPAKMARIDPATGSMSEAKSLPGVEADSEWAFAFYAGDFYAFTAKAGGSGLPQDDLGSVVTRHRPSDNTTVRLRQLAFKVVGAGVSTCAPVALTK